MDVRQLVYGRVYENASPGAKSAVYDCLHCFGLRSHTKACLHTSEVDSAHALSAHATLHVRVWLSLITRAPYFSAWLFRLNYTNFTERNDYTSLAPAVFVLFESLIGPIPWGHSTPIALPSVTRCRCCRCCRCCCGHRFAGGVRQ